MKQGCATNYFSSIKNIFAHLPVSHDTYPPSSPLHVPFAESNGAIPAQVVGVGGGRGEGGLPVFYEPSLSFLHYEEVFKGFLYFLRQGKRVPPLFLVM